MTTNDDQPALDAAPTNEMLILADQENTALRGVVSRGFARWARTAPGASNELINVVYDVRHLPRNSDGVVVQGTDLETIRADTNLDNNDITYNDGSVAVESSVSAGEVTLTADVRYHFDNDDDPTTPLTVEDGDGDGTNTEILITRNIGETVRIRAMLSTDALDLHDGEAGKAVPVVLKADSQDVDDEVTVTNIFADDDVFLADNTTAEDDTDDNPELVYSYDSDDLYIDSSSDGDGAEISMEKFEARLGSNFNIVTTDAVVEVLVYDVDGQSIFRIITRADGS